ncbi:MAG TPA: lipocalin family protein [Pseudobdellovibrionaceae bacterium]|nr:lipocalin family protein [Pseudobdellovibrionaceae bacterium]
MIKAVLTLAVSMMAVGTVKAAEAVDLEQYSGVWYEIARTPETFESGCVSNVKAEYTVLEEGILKVVNTCTTATGEVKTVSGLAQATDDNTLLVSFEPLESGEDPADVDAWDFTDPGHYQILEVGSDYSYAVVGTPDRSSAWILSRTPDMSAEDLTTAQGVLTEQGYDTCVLMTTVQDGGMIKSSQLCKANDETGASDEGTVTPPEETTPPDEGTTVPGDPAVLDVLRTSGQFTQFLAAVEAAGLTETLKSEGPFTLFVPSDEAFNKLTEAQRTALMDDPSTLASVLYGHIMMGDYKAADLAALNEPKNLVEGAMTFTVVDGVQQVNGAKIVMADVEAGNGTIHVIDTVLMN